MPTRPLKSSSTATALAAATVILVVLGLYLATYYSMLQSSSLVVYRHEHDLGQLAPMYHFGGETSRTLFSLAHQIDRVARPDRWDIRGLLPFPPEVDDDATDDLNRGDTTEVIWMPLSGSP